MVGNLGGAAEVRRLLSAGELKVRVVGAAGAQQRAKRTVTPLPEHPRQSELVSFLGNAHTLSLSFFFFLTKHFLIINLNSGIHFFSVINEVISAFLD